tara:strand:+ start:2673 stop:3308 length:636 start_codon:yes stop_codon:yes gene_type:complete
MGFDLTGLNPTVNKVYPQRYNDIMSKYGKDGWLDWQKDIPEDIKDEYFELKDQYQMANPGDYFRNNVWWWRPLWSFVVVSCGNILTEKDIEHGSFNDGHKISKTKAIRIGKKLSKLLADGTVDEIDKIEALKVAKAKVHNDDIEQELTKIQDACKKEHGKDIVPANYPEPYKSQWNKMYAKRDWDSSYPFDKGNVEAFAEFCLQSGGFEIC